MSQDGAFQSLTHDPLHESGPVAPTRHRKVAYSITPKLMAGYTVTGHTAQPDVKVCVWVAEEKAVREVNEHAGSCD